jgi:hypothetical protein
LSDILRLIAELRPPPVKRSGVMRCIANHGRGGS